MKILQAMAQYPGKTGSGTYLQAIAKEAHKRGHKQAVIAGISMENEEVEFKDCADITFYPVVFNTENLPFPIVGMSDVMPYMSTRYSDMNEEMFILWEKAFKEKIELALKEFKPDIIITHHLWLLTSLIRNMAPNIPVMAICHGTDLRQLELTEKFREYAVDGCKNIEAAFALNDLQREKIIQSFNICEDKIITIGGGYDSDIFYPKDKASLKGSIKLIYAGKLSYAKGTMSLIKVFQRVRKKYEDVELIIAGSGSGEEEQIMKQVNKAEDGIHFLGEVPHEELGNLFRECDIFIMPSFYEGLSLVTIEALACGLSVVASEITGLKNWLGDEVNNSGIISYVKLPSMLKVDKPKESELPHYEENLERAILDQLVNLDEKKNQFIGISKIVQELSWSNIFEKIEENLYKICK